jgi:hypothetical protein
MWGQVRGGVWGVASSSKTLFWQTTLCCGLFVIHCHTCLRKNYIMYLSFTDRFRRQSSWLQIQWSGFDSLRYQIFWEVEGLERGPLSLVSTTEELLGRKSSGSGLESREYSRRDHSRWPRGSLYPQKLALISLASDGRSIGIVRSRTQATEFSPSFAICWSYPVSHLP